ncbi:MAG: glycosyltransferase family 4 protein [Alphaproteobacteria bacterium]|nr:glycosyltransferase family 4 protein [Alphaproteobacteria bacterium]
MKLCMVAASLAGGGAERALLDTAALLTSRGHHVTVLTFESESTDAYAVPDGVSRIVLGIPGQSGNRLRGLLNNLDRILSLRARVRQLQPDVVISHLTRTNIICLLALLGTGRALVVTEHNVATLKDAPMQPLWRALRRVLYSRAAQVVVVSKGLAGQYAWLGADKLTAIYNFLPASRDSGGQSFDFLSPNTRYIVGMGRLESEKGFDRLIRAFHLIEKDCPGWNLLIVGEGSLRTEVAGLAASLGLRHRVALPGRVSNPRALFRQCGIFVLSSESEGFGLVLVEAMSAGLPVISFDCDFGPREIIAQEATGILVPAGDVGALSRAIARLVADGVLRRQLARGALETLGRFAPETILDQWELLLRRVARRKTPRPEAHLPTQATERP